jgi:hypothetical protein
MTGIPNAPRWQGNFGDNEIFLQWTPCPLGGQRPWFLCPTCRRRCAKLYIGEGQSLCRKCRGLSYDSQRENRQARSERRINKIRTKLGAEGGFFLDFPPKPSGMHMDTYWRLWEKARKGYDQWFAPIRRFLQAEAQIEAMG